MKTTSSDILANIIKIRNDRSLTQASVAESINVDYSTYSKLESGITKLSIDRLEKIASFFNLDIIDILTYPQKFIPKDKETDTNAKKPKVLLQIELEEDQKEQIMKVVFGEKNLNVFK